MRLRDRWGKFRNRVDGRVSQINYEHRLCGACGSIQDRHNKICEICGQRLLPPWLDKLSRLRFLSPEFFTPTSLLISVILIAYYFSATASGGNLMAPTSVGLLRYGANFPPAVFAGDWWRLGTCILLHGGAMHILFNLVALQQIGPEVENIFGKGRMLFFFMITGIAASLGSALWRGGGVGIGASGALMGLVGLAAGWGQRTGGNAGIMARNLMVQWGLYTIVFGFLIGADNAAHVSGLVSGFALGLVARPVEDKKRSRTFGAIETSLGILLFVLTAVMLFFPPRSVLDHVETTIESAQVISCGEFADPAPNNVQSEIQIQGDCRQIQAKLGNNFGIKVLLKGTPPGEIPFLTARMTHPPISNPESGKTTTVDEWEAVVPLGSAEVVSWRFDFPWELVAGEWLLQVLDEEHVLAEQKFAVLPPAALSQTGLSQTELN